MSVLFAIISIGFISFGIYMHRADKRALRELIDEIKLHPNPATIDSGTIIQLYYDGAEQDIERSKQ
jgi:hypothetical protein